METFVVTTIGVGIDTGVSVFKTYEEAKDEMSKKIKSLQIADAQEVGKDCVKGCSLVAQCDVELEVHKCGENNPQEKSPVAKAIEGVLDDAYEFVCNELDARGIPYDSSNTDKIFVNDKEEKKTHCINIFSSVCLAYEGE